MHLGAAAAAFPLVRQQGLRPHPDAEAPRLYPLMRCFMELLTFPKRQAVAAEAEAEAPPAATADAEADARTGTNEDLRSHPEGSSSLPEQPQRADTAPSPDGSLESPQQQQPPGASIPRSGASYVLAQFLGGAVEIDVDGGARETVAAPSSADAYHFSYKFPC